MSYENNQTNNSDVLPFVFFIGGFGLLMLLAGITQSRESKVSERISEHEKDSIRHVVDVSLQNILTMQTNDLDSAFNILSQTTVGRAHLFAHNHTFYKNVYSQKLKDDAFIETYVTTNESNALVGVTHGINTGIATGNSAIGIANGIAMGTMESSSKKISQSHRKSIF